MSKGEEHDSKKDHGGHGKGHGGGSHEEHEGAPEWLISFADNVTLMMGFFVILLAMNLKPASSGTGTPTGGDSKEPGYAQPTPETLDLAIAIREAFHNPVDPNSSNPIDIPLLQRLRERSGESQAERDGQIGREHDVRSIRPSDYYSPAGSVPFEDGSSTLNEASRRALEQISPQIRGHNLVVEVRGHVSAAEAFGRSDRGMRLSYERTAAVAEALVADGVPWGNLRVVACADNDRLVGVAYDAAGHRANQRVELIVTDEVVKEHTPADGQIPPFATDPAQPK